MLPTSPEAARPVADCWMTGGAKSSLSKWMMIVVETIRARKSRPSGRALASGSRKTSRFSSLDYFDLELRVRLPNGGADYGKHRNCVVHTPERVGNHAAETISRKPANKGRPTPNQADCRHSHNQDLPLDQPQIVPACRSFGVTGNAIFSFATRSKGPAYSTETSPCTKYVPCRQRGPTARPIGPARSGAGMERCAGKSLANNLRSAQFL